MNKEIKEKAINIVKAVKENPYGIVLLAGILSLASVLLLTREDDDLYETSTPPTGPNLVKEEQLEGSLPSEQVFNEIPATSRAIPQVLNFMERTGDVNFLTVASKLRESYDRGVIYVTDVQKPEETNFVASSGRFPGTWVEWERQQALKIAVPKTLLNDPNLSDLDLACRLNVNLIFTERLEGLSIPLTLEDVGEMVQSAVEETEDEFSCKMSLGDFQVKYSEK